MKKILAALCLMMSLPTLTLAAGQNMISVSELHRQAEEMGRWQKTYATPNGELNVDIPILEYSLRRYCRKQPMKCWIIEEPACP